MDILVINEPFVKDFCRTQRWAARTRGRVLRAPDWLAYATAVLEEAGYSARLVDMVAEGQDKQDLIPLLKREKPSFVVMDSTTPSIFSDIDCCRIVKEECGAFVILAGPHVSALPEETLQIAGQAVDAVCIGEYDHTVRDIIASAGKLQDVPGIAYLKDGKAVRTAVRPLIEDLDMLPFPAWHHLDLKKYFDGGKLYPYIDVISGRGCPNQCLFCLWPQVMHGTRYRFRSPANVVDEIERDIKLCPQVVRGGEFFFEDDTFTVNKERAINICEELLRRKLKITFSVNARVDSADRELFGVMKRAGCRELLAGFESGDQSVLDTARKNITLDQSRRFMSYAREAKLEVHGCFVIGLPGETRESAAKTLDFAMSLGLTTAQFSGAVPFPGTEFFRLCEKEGWLKSRRWSDWLDTGEQSAVVEYPAMSQASIARVVDSGLKRFYLRPAYVIRFIFQTRSWPDLYRKLRGGWNFFSYLWRR